MKASTRSRIALLFLAILLITLLLAPIAEAAIKDSWNNTKAGVSKVWQKTKIYVKSAAYWINALLIFAAIFLLVSLVFKDKLSDKNQQVMVYILIGVFALILATKVVDDMGRPAYIWSQEKFRHSTQFLIGPTSQNAMSTCPGEAWGDKLWNGVKAGFGAETDTPCCGTGSYFRTIGGREICKQAILRTNENGSGLMAFIIGSILIYVVLVLLLKDALNDETGKKIKVALAILIGALMANDRLTKDQLLMIAGWIAFIYFAKKMLSKYKDKEGKADRSAFVGKMFAVAIPYALVNLILGVFGTSLWGSTIDAGTVTFGTIILDLLKGCMLGAAYSMMTGEMAGYFKDKARVETKDLMKHMDKEKALGRMLLHDIPGIGTISDWLYRKKHGLDPEKAAEKRKTEIDAKVNEIRALVIEKKDRINKLMLYPPGTPHASILQTEIQNLENEIQGKIAEYNLLVGR